MGVILESGHIIVRDVSDPGAQSRAAFLANLLQPGSGTVSPTFSDTGELRIVVASDVYGGDGELASPERPSLVEKFETIETESKKKAAAETVNAQQVMETQIATVAPNLGAAALS